MRKPMRRLTFLCVALALAPAAALANLVVNEVDYDQIGTDAAEYLELKNTGPGSVLLSDYQVELSNGSAGGAVYQTIALPGVSLAAGDYFVICANAGTVVNCDLDISPDTNLIQNGSPDGIGVRHIGSNTIVDALSYEGNTPGYTEGTGTSIADDNVTADLVLARDPDGHDTDDNSADFVLATGTPGASNTPEVPVGGVIPVAAAAASLLLGGGLVLVRRRS